MRIKRKFQILLVIRWDFSDDAMIPIFSQPAKIEWVNINKSKNRISIPLDDFEKGGGV